MCADMEFGQTALNRRTRLPDWDEGAFAEFLIGWSRMLWVLSKATSMCKQQEQMVGYIVLYMTSDGNLEVSVGVRNTEGAEGGRCQFQFKGLNLIVQRNQ